MYYIDNGYYPKLSSTCNWDNNCWCISYQSCWTDSTVGGIGQSLAPYFSSLPVDPINNASSGGPWDTGRYVYAYGNVGKISYIPQYDLVGQLENYNNSLACKFKCYKWLFNINRPSSPFWCTSCGYIYSDYIYDVSQQ